MTDNDAYRMGEYLTAEKQRIGMINHDLVAHFDHGVIEKILKQPKNRLKHHQKGKDYGNQTR